MAIAIALLDLRILDVRWPLFFFPETDLFAIISTLSKNEKKKKKKINVGIKLKKIQDFCPRDIEFCHLVAARRVKLWSLNAILFFKEPV